MKLAAILSALLSPGFLLAANGSADDAKAIVTGGPYELTVIKDIAYNDARDADPVKHKLDLYLPKGQKDFPVLFFVHGGSWRHLDKAIYGPVGALFARNGVGTVMINYRLTPKVMHPGHIQDVARAFAWTHRHIARYSGRPDEIFIGGHSAGAHLVALLATDPAYLKAEKLALSDIKGVIPISGVYVIKPLPALVKVFGKDAEGCKQASPVEHVKGHHPPFLICYADDDFRYCDVMSEQLCKGLKGCKCKAVSMKVADRDHTSIMVKAASRVDDPVTQAMLKFMARHSGLRLKAREKK